MRGVGESLGLIPWAFPFPWAVAPLDSSKIEEI